MRQSEMSFLDNISSAENWKENELKWYDLTRETAEVEGKGDTVCKTDFILALPEIFFTRRICSCIIYVT